MVDVGLDLGCEQALELLPARTVILEAGDIVSIPEQQSQCTEVMEDTQLIYIFFDE